MTARLQSRDRCDGAEASNRASWPSMTRLESILGMVAVIPLGVLEEAPRISAQPVGPNNGNMSSWLPLCFRVRLKRRTTSA